MPPPFEESGEESSDGESPQPPSSSRRKPLDARRKREALRELREFGKKMKLDAGLTIRALAGGDVVELDDLLAESTDADADAFDDDSSDGLSEAEFAVDPEAGLRPDPRDESFIDPETGDFVEPRPPEPEPEPEPDPPPDPEAGADPEEKPELENDDNPEGEEKSKSGGALNVRRNIREVMDEKQLDASTLAAQRLESERLARVQEQQRIIREVRRQIALGRQEKTQARVLSLLQGRAGSSVLRKDFDPNAPPGMQDAASARMPSGDMRKVPKPSLQDFAKMHKSKYNLTPSVSIAPVGALRHDPAMPGISIKKDVVEIVDSSSTTSSSESGPSSDSDDCIMLSDSELPPSPEPEDDPQNSGLHVNDAYNIPDEQGRVVINVGHPENESDIFLAPQIARIIKPHQIGGVRFLFDNIIESVERFSTSTGFGCILAHSMGLGKTLQIVCFCDIFLRHTDSKTVLCIMPINTLQNWVAEFNMWLPLDPSNSPLSAGGEVRSRNFPIYVLNDSHKTLQARAKVIKEWKDVGGVLMIGYELYRLLSLKKNKKPRNRKKKNDPISTLKNLSEAKEKLLGKDVNSQHLGENRKSNDMFEIGKDKTRDIDMKDMFLDKKDDDDGTEEEKNLLEEMYSALVKPGPDLVICDEGHRIKNSHSNISYALKQMRTKRRVVLTGYPLQNNLLEYWCMVDFVRPNYLGTKTEFSNMFERPIQNGQCIDSTPQDIRLMRYRAHVLHSLLVGFVQRRSHAVLQSTLPQKEEYVLLVKMSELQRKLYDVFMNEVVRKTTVPNPLKAFAVCCKIWNHPDVLYYFLKKRNESAAIVDFDLEIEDGTINTNNPTPNGKKGKEKKTKTPTKKKEKASPQSNKIGKPAATIPPNTSTTEKPESFNSGFVPVKTELPSVSQSFNNHIPFTSVSNDVKTPFGTSSNSGTNYSTYPNYQQFESNNYYGQNGSYDSSYNSGYYQNQSFNNYNNYGTTNPQLPADSAAPAPQQAVTRYPNNPEYNSQPYWGSENNYYNNQNSGYYPNQSQPNYQSGQNSYGSYNPYSQQNPSYNFNQNQIFNNTNQSASNTPYQSSDTSAIPPNGSFDGLQANGTNASAYNSSTFSNIPNTLGSSDSSVLDNKQLVKDEISNMCWSAGSEDVTKAKVDATSKLLSDVKNEIKTDSDGEIKIADLDTNKVIINDKPKIPMEELKPEVKNEDLKTTQNDQSILTNENIIEKDKVLVDEKQDTSNRDLKLKEMLDRKPNHDLFKPKDRKCKNNKDKSKNSGEGTSDHSDVEGDKKEKEETERKSDKYEEVSYDWATDLLKNYTPGVIENSAKMELFFCILNESIHLGDRLLLFSQSLFTLNLIEDFLQRNVIPGTDITWAKNKSYYRLDGSTSALEREKLINEFNINPNVHLFLVSTRAGSLGINLVGANRVVVFDASWNPCHDTQAVCRVYRYGQKKPCFVYRLVMDCCLEKKIYDRQINKQGMADRVVDECNPDAVLSLKEVTNLCFDNDDKEVADKEFSKDCVDKYLDIIMKNIIEEHRKTLSKEPFQHESLLVDRKEKKLSSAEKRLAKRGYELEKKAAANPKPSMMYRTIRSADGTIIQRPVASVRPMQHAGTGVGGTRWIPADVWQRQGMTAQEMTLPLDVVIPTNSAEKSNIVLKAGQKVMVLKSPKGIYMQLESGKIIAIKTSFKVGQTPNKPTDPKDIPKKILPMRPSNVNLPGSLKNNSAITVISKSARGGMQKIITRPPIIQKKIGTPVRPMITGPRILDPKIAGMNANLQVRPYPMIRGRSPILRNPKPPLQIQNSLNLKLQDSFNQSITSADSNEMILDLEKDKLNDDFDSNGENSHGSHLRVPSIEQATAKFNDAINQEGVDSMNNDNKPNSDDIEKPIHTGFSDDVISEDSSQEKTYVDLSNNAELAMTNKFPSKSSPTTTTNIFRECNIQIKNKNVMNTSPELGYLSNLTIKRSFPQVSGMHTPMPIMKEKPFQPPIHIHPSESSSSEGTLADYKLPQIQNCDSDNIDDDLTIRERKTYKPNLVDRKASSLKNYRHPRMPQKPMFIHQGEYPVGKLSPASTVSTSSTPTPPPIVGFPSMSQKSNKDQHQLEKFESSISQLEKTTSAMIQTPKKGGMSEFQQSLTNITQTYSPDNSKVEPLYKPGPKSRKKKVLTPSQPESQATNTEILNSTTERYKSSINTNVDLPMLPNQTPLVNNQNAAFTPTPFNSAEGISNNPTGFAESSFQQHVPNDPALPQQPYNSYPVYPPAGSAYPPYPPAPYYQAYPPTPYPPYTQYPPSPYPTSYPNPYPGYPPYPNPNHQW